MQETFSNSSASQNQLKHQLKTIFIFYSSFGDRSNVHYLKSSKLHKLMSDSQVIDNQYVTKNNLDLIFVQLNKTSKNMEFKKFLELLTKVAQLKYPESIGDNSLELLLQNNLFPLYQLIMTQTDLGEDYVKFSVPIQEDVFTAVSYIGPVLMNIYLTYFGLDLKKKSETALFHFLGLFEICPELITKSTAYLLFNDLVEAKVISEIEKLNAIFNTDHGRVFTFYKFVLFLMRVALIVFDHSQHLERVAALLEKMERSQGFNGFEKKIHSPHNSKIRLAIGQHIMLMIQNHEGNQVFKAQEIQPKMISPKATFSNRLVQSKVIKQQSEQQNEQQQEENLEFSVQVSNIFKLYENKLQEYFQSLINNPLYQKIKITSFIELLKNANIYNVYNFILFFINLKLRRIILNLKKDALQALQKLIFFQIKC